MARAVIWLIGILLFGASAIAAPPRAPRILIDDREPAEIAWENPFIAMPGWVRVDARMAPGIVAQGWRSAECLLVDVFNVGSAPVRIAFAEVSGDPGEFDRVVPPHCGIGWSSAPPSLSDEDIGSGPWDHEYLPHLFAVQTATPATGLPAEARDVVAQPAQVKSTWTKLDYPNTSITGSPRNRFYSGHRWRADHGGVTRAMEAWFDRWVRWQLMRPYQGADPIRALPRPLVGMPYPKGLGAATQYPDIGAVWAGDALHWTVGNLADAVMLCGDPRAMDQLVRAQLWMSTTDWYWIGKGAIPYGGIERVPGWMLLSYAEAFEAAGQMGLGFLATRWAMEAEAQVARLLSIGCNELGLPNVYLRSWDSGVGTHLGPVDQNLPWQTVVGAFGARRCHDLIGTPGAKELADLWLDAVEEHGWDHAGVVYDSVPHHAADRATIAPKAAGIPGIGLWPAAALIACERDESPMLLFIVGKAKELKSGGHPLFSPHNNLSLFGPMLEWPE